MEKKENKSKNILIGVLAFIIVVLIGLYVYLLFIKKDEVGNNSHIQATNLYSIYSSNLKNKILNNATDFFEVGTGRMYDKNVYVALLNKKLELIVRIEKKQFNSNLLGDYIVAKNVIGFTIAQTGPGDEANVYFIKEDGTVGCAKVGQVFSAGEETIEVVDNYLNLKDITSIIQTSHDYSGTTKEPIFIDINGKVFINTDTAWD